MLVLRFILMTPLAMDEFIGTTTALSLVDAAGAEDDKMEEDDNKEPFGAPDCLAADSKFARKLCCCRACAAARNPAKYMARSCACLSSPLPAGGAEASAAAVTASAVGGSLLVPPLLVSMMEASAASIESFMDE